MGDISEMDSDRALLDDDFIEDNEPFLMDGTGDFISEDFNDYVSGDWMGSKHPALMNQDTQRDELTRLRHELHNPPKDDLQVQLEQSENKLQDHYIDSVVKRFGEPYKNVAELRTKLNQVDNAIKELNKQKEFLKQQLDNWTGERNACLLCGKPMVKRGGKFGEFYGCTGFPECRGTRKIEESSKEVKANERT